MLFKLSRQINFKGRSEDYHTKAHPWLIEPPQIALTVMTIT